MKSIEKINSSRFTRIPFWKNNPENIIGLLNIRTLSIDIKNYQNEKKIIIRKINQTLVYSRIYKFIRSIS